MSDKLKALEERIEKLEHALLVMATWHYGQDEYVKNILGPEAVQCAEVEHGHSSDDPLFKGDSIHKIAEDMAEEIAENVLKDSSHIVEFLAGFAKEKR